MSFGKRTGKAGPKISELRGPVERAGKYLNRSIKALVILVGLLIWVAWGIAFSSVPVAGNWPENKCYLSPVGFHAFMEANLPRLYWKSSINNVNAKEYRSMSHGYKISLVHNPISLRSYAEQLHDVLGTDMQPCGLSGSLCSRYLIAAIAKNIYEQDARYCHSSPLDPWCAEYKTIVPTQALTQMSWCLGPIL